MDDPTEIPKVTWMPADQYDELVDTLDQPDAIPPAMVAAIQRVFCTGAEGVCFPDQCEACGADLADDTQATRDAHYATAHRPL